MSDILILTHAEFCPPGHLGAVLAARGLDFRVIRADLGELAGLDAERPRAVAIMGGPMSVNDDLPWLRDELALLRRFIERRIPLIGHCLGGQLLARALGATVRHQPYTEMGWQPMQRESRDSPWLAGCRSASRSSSGTAMPSTCRRAPSACCPARGARTRGFPGAITYSACKAIRK